MTSISFSPLLSQNIEQSKYVWVDPGTSNRYQVNQIIICQEILLVENTFNPFDLCVQFYERLGYLLE